jgi:hypothetical protein
MPMTMTAINAARTPKVIVMPLHRESSSLQNFS